MLEEYFLDAVEPLCIKTYQTKQEQVTTMEDEGPVITSLTLKHLCCKALSRGKLRKILPFYLSVTFNISVEENFICCYFML